MGFVDDVEFFFQPDNSTVEYRSASRLGEGDFDVNRKRIKDIRVALQESVSCETRFKTQRRGESGIKFLTLCFHAFFHSFQDKQWASVGF